MAATYCLVHNRTVTRCVGVPGDVLRRRILGPADTPERRAVFEKHFVRGAPRKVRHFLEHVGVEEERVLDVGCGFGAHLVHFPPGSRGVDRDPERVAFANTLGLDVEVRDVERADWTAGLGNFDLVWVCDLLTHLVDPGAFIGSVSALLGSGGSLVLCDWLWPRSASLRAVALMLPGRASGLLPSRAHPSIHRRGHPGAAL